MHEYITVINSINYIINEYLRTLQVTYSLKELAQIGQCNSHVNVRDSPIPNAGRGVFARKNIAKGELIQVSPLLAVARHKVGYVFIIIVL